MHDPAGGELNSPGTGGLEWSGTGRCKNPIRVASAGLHSGVVRVGAVRRLIDTLWCGRDPRVIARFGQARERSLGEVRGKVFARKP